ncbi:MAG: VC0807 family protein [Salinisphaera sp.]|uniref:VC0807 family protein n=1 Tax=Salinisphaera sp. TaxID=1914330 RepID=UPI003C79AFB0
MNRFNDRFWYQGARLAVELGVNCVLPLLIYDQLAPSIGDVAALMASSVPPMLWAVIEFIRRRQLDAVSVLVLAGIALSLLAMIGSGSARFLQLRENLVTALIGLVFLGSVVVRRPLIYYLARAGIQRSAPDQTAAFEALRHTPYFHRAMTIMTLAWGMGLLLSTAVACVLVFSVSIHEYLIVQPFVGYGTMGLLLLWTMAYRRHLRKHADWASVLESGPVR